MRERILLASMLAAFAAVSACAQEGQPHGYGVDLPAAALPTADLPTADLKVTAENRTRRRVEQIALREPDGIEQDSDSFGYDGLAPGRRRTFTIAGGADVCIYEIAVLFEEKEEDCCSDPLPIGQQDQCRDPRIIVHD